MLLQAANASENIAFPSRGFWLGRSQSGKTTHLVDFVCNAYVPTYGITRIIIVCPNFSYQKAFQQMRSDPNITKLIRPEDIYEKPHQLVKETFTRITDSITNTQAKYIASCLPPPRVLIIIDDLTGKKLIQNRGQGPFSNLSTRTPHINTSMFVIAHQPKSVDINFRMNCEFIIAYQCDGKVSIEYLKEAYCSILIDPPMMRNILKTAWMGGKLSTAEIGQHFLFILVQPRKHTRFFIDFNEEIKLENE